MSVSEFWTLTPRELSIVFRAHARRQEDEDFRAALIASMLFNLMGRRKNRKPLPVRAFMPERGRKKERKVQTPEEQLSILRQIVEARGGTVTET